MIPEYSVTFDPLKMPEAPVEEMEGIEVTGNAQDTTPLMTGQEKRILEVYDRLEELQLEIALLKAQGVLSRGQFLESYNLSYSHDL